MLLFPLSVGASLVGRSTGQFGCRHDESFLAPTTMLQRLLRVPQRGQRAMALPLSLPVGSLLHAATTQRLFSSVPAVVPSATPSSTSAPAYTVTDATVAGGAAPTKKWGKFVLRSIKGHTKKLNPVARQVSWVPGSQSLSQKAQS